MDHKNYPKKKSPAKCRVSKSAGPHLSIDMDMMMILKKGPTGCRSFFTYLARSSSESEPCNETSALIQSSHKYLIKGRRLDYCVCIFTLLRFLPAGIHCVELANYPTDNERGKVTQHPENSLQQQQFMQREKFYEQIIPDEMECVWVEW